ncbi:hypothetical protein [Nakamurella leprariae]|uniref:DUF1453 domain-containing protein n=1 Tax=Nakamurella leprariae TaxID=2803911 RepID=A0A938YGX9_9ACTN|nr:hypothetical protein [Nakamurella leprariae]MBM9469311.1 hypothetical protein [Nakamurella leprariae]
MSVNEIIILVLMVGYAIYRQTQRHEVVGDTRFKLAIVYGIVGLVVGGYHVPDTGWEIGFLVASLGLSVIVGLLRGNHTKVWNEGGRVLSQGTTFTISLFVLMVLAKVGLGTVAYFADISDSGGFGEILLMVALMMVFQAQIIWRRAEPLGARHHGTDPVDPTGTPDLVQPRS